MIVVLGRPMIRPAPAGLGDDRIDLTGLASRIALETARRGGRVELVGSVGDDPDGDRAIVELGRGGVGHAAVLRDPAGVTPGGTVTGPQPRLDAGDVELGLRYLPDCRVVVVAEALPDDAAAAAAEGARYHGAALVAVVVRGSTPPRAFADGATVLELPTTEDPSPDSPAAEDPGQDDPGDAFAALVAAYVVALDRGEDAALAFEAAVREARWDRSSDG
jgi:hypothetical protein